MGPSSVRRNLFSSNLSKRSGSTLPPIQGGSNSNSNSTNASNLQSPTHTTSSTDTIPLNNGNSATIPSERTNDTGDIVVKDKNGSYKLDIPVLPLGNGDDEDDMDTIEDIQNGGRVIDPTGSGETILCGKEKERRSLECRLSGSSFTVYRANVLL